MMKTCFNCGSNKFHIVTRLVPGVSTVECDVAQCVNCDTEMQILSYRFVENKSIIFDSPNTQKCMFDGLPPGTYGLVCNCPRCRIYC